MSAKQFMSVRSLMHYSIHWVHTNKFYTSTSLFERQQSTCEDKQLGQRKPGRTVSCGTHTSKNELRLYHCSSENVLLNIIAYLQKSLGYTLHAKWRAPSSWLSVACLDYRCSKPRTPGVCLQGKHAAITYWLHPSSSTGTGLISCWLSWAFHSLASAWIVVYVSCPQSC